VVLALWLVTLRGYGGLALALAPPALYQLWRLAPDPSAGVEVSWQRGRWSLGRDGVRRAVVPHRRTVVTRWVVCLVYEYAPRSARNYLWLYADSLPAGDQRRLRARLALHRAGG